MIEIITVLLKGPKKYRFEYFKETVTKSKKMVFQNQKKYLFCKNRKKTSKKSTFFVKKEPCEIGNIKKNIVRLNSPILQVWDLRDHFDRLKKVAFEPPNHVPKP